MKRLSVTTAAVVCFLAAAVSAPVQAASDTPDQSKPLVVFAAASLKNAMDGVVSAYEKQHPDTDVKVSYAGSSTLARQIEAGAPADVYVSANQQWMDKLGDDGLIDKQSRYNLLGNSLVLVAPKDSKAQVKLVKNVDLASKLGQGGYLAMANTDAVPAGIYGKHALQHLGVWKSLSGRIAQADDVRAALALVSRGESPFGVVYSSDAVADKGVRVVDTFPEDSHKPIVYPAAATADSDNPADAEFLGFLKSDTAAPIFKRWGFRLVSQSGGQ
ncbi:molybdate ABC transporter substrate-binding protein [Salinisphaera sp. Q1T1-3]|uniref:molybdate ABC transporter substrate-binding protein n=1 Tax=Salinisphaera sp. Q1T1-3 TaxID=2321229 RepID=UPI000E73B46C|nr:molybdate ABC transporter substrate-binding protein [Salinisphaera sp. Q1T1-3]RJS94797.1 molybdate ABC transporter substrate-binding protein [Salinisphaera sp. Q1T1-3]